MINKNYIALLHKIWLSHSKLHLIYIDYKDFKLFYNELSSALLFSYGFSPKQIEYILAEKKSVNIDTINTKIKELKIKIITFVDLEYPTLLKNINNPPFLFYLRWKIDNTPKISVVWTRKMSNYWKKAISTLIWDISKYFTIVSWWAIWCDTEAHQVTIKNGWKTISVIWTWIDIDYPSSNYKLYNDIVYSWWGVVSIFPFGELWKPHNFPVRNEIVAWLSNWVILVEAQIRSWTLITANLALDLWKDLFAVPGDIYSTNSNWCNLFISKWYAKLISKPDDLLIEYNISWDINNNTILNEIKFSDDIEKNIYDILLIEKFTINELKEKINIDISTLSFKLSMMEINKYIKKWLWWKYELF